MVEVDGLAVALQGAKEQQSHALPGIGFPGLLSPRIFKFGMSLVNGWRECGQVYRDFQPTAVVGMGGFTSAIPLLLGRAEARERLQAPGQAGGAEDAAPNREGDLARGLARHGDKRKSV